MIRVPCCPFVVASSYSVMKRLLTAISLLTLTGLGVVSAPAPIPASMDREAEIKRRIRIDYSLTEEELFQKLNNSLNQLTRDEFNIWLREGSFDSQTFDGVRRFVGTSVSNLFWRRPELEARRRVPLERPAYLESLLGDARKVKAVAAKQKRSHVLPQRYDVSMTVTVDAIAVPAGEIIRAWLPVPRRTLALTKLARAGTSVTMPASTTRSCASTA